MVPSDGLYTFKLVPTPLITANDILACFIALNLIGPDHIQSYPARLLSRSVVSDASLIQFQPWINTPLYNAYRKG